MSSTALGILLGILVGLRHAFEPDHLTAVSTLVTETHSPRQGALLGIAWGLGHTISLVVVGSLLAIAGATLPPRAAVCFELGVAAMLLLLGVRAIWVARRRYAQRDALDAGHTHHLGGKLRSLAVGLVHGLAGSGALTALVFAQLPSTGTRILYIVLFGAGSIVGMAVASGLAGQALRMVAGSQRVRMQIGVVTGVLSIAVGLGWGIPLLV
jgi:high-affinity nickel-transport protein